jgi:hypothetical protein
MLMMMKWTAALAAVLRFAVLAAGCGGSNSPGPAAGGSSSALFAKFLAYSRYMRSHGISDFPDPTTSGGVGIVLSKAPGSDLDPNNPRFKAASQACQSVAPEAHAPQAPSAQKIAAEVKLADCMRSHGLPSFPDPNGQGGFDRSKFNESTPAFRAARKACRSLINAVGPIPVH